MMRTLYVIFLVAFIVSGCASAKVKKHVDKIIAPSSSYEKCVGLLPSQTLVYLFKASEPVKFKVHFHGGEEVMYPVSEGRVSSWWDKFEPEEEEEFCFTWENTQSYHITLYVEYEIREKK